MAQVKWFLKGMVLLKATQWWTEGDHEAVQVDNLVASDAAYLRRTDGERLRVRPGNWITEDGDRLRVTFPRAVERVGVEVPVFIHLKTGNLYVKLFDTEDCTNGYEGDKLTVYVPATPGPIDPAKIYSRESGEFLQKFKPERADVMQVMADAIGEKFGLEVGTPYSEVIRHVAKTVGAAEDAEVEKLFAMHKTTRP